MNYNINRLLRVLISEENNNNIALWKEPFCIISTFTFDTLSTFFW